MKTKVKKLLAAVTVVSALAVPVIAYASTELVYYSWNYTSSGTGLTVESATFATTNPNQIVTINGWQQFTQVDSNTRVNYQLVNPLGSVFGPTYYAGPTYYGNIPQSPSSGWYNYEFTNIPNANYYVLANIFFPANSTASGAGNAYDGT